MAFASLAPYAQATENITTHQLDKGVSFQAVTWQNDTVVASGSGGGIYLSDDNGLQWRKINGASIARTAQEFDLSAATVKRYCAKAL